MPVGADSPCCGVNALAVFNGELIAGGAWTMTAGEAYVGCLAHWNGTTWQSLGGGVDGPFPDVNELLVHQGQLIVGGDFVSAGGMAAGFLARWGCTDCAGDVNGDHDVDVDDLTALLNGFGTLSGAMREDGDLDADGDVDISDLTELLSHYGRAC
jgi:hypothetical protein